MTGRGNGFFQRLPRVTVRIGDVPFFAMPDTIEVKRRGNLREICTAAGQTKAVCTGGGRRIVQGKGVCFGADAASQFSALEEKFGGEDTLFLPETVPFTAVFCTLTVTRREDAAVWFSFGFEETEEGHAQ